MKRWHLQDSHGSKMLQNFNSFGDFAENSKSLTNFQDSEDAYEDLISSLGTGIPTGNWDDRINPFAEHII